MSDSMRQGFALLSTHPHPASCACDAQSWLDPRAEDQAHMSVVPADEVEAFLSKWSSSQAAECANAQMFLLEFCALLGVESPAPAVADPEQNHYVFEHKVTVRHTDGSLGVGRIDLYKRDCFILEAKQGANKRTALQPSKPGKRKGTAIRGSKTWDQAMVSARLQAERYARSLPPGERPPPFLIVLDVGHTIELFAEFERNGKTYAHFPDSNSYRIHLNELRNPDVRARLKTVWDSPESLDPTSHSARVTKKIAEYLAELAKSLESEGHAAQDVAAFLMRCLFTMFAEDIELLPARLFTQLLSDCRGAVDKFEASAEFLWRAMDEGGFHPTIMRQLLRFNGGLFHEPSALPLSEDQLSLLLLAADADWQDVEPAIFGTLLERALDPKERHKLGAHFTPRAFVEQLVRVALMEPLREDWRSVLAASVAQASLGKLSDAQALVREFHARLCEIKVLDPACGSGNFLYIALEHMKRLEGEVLQHLADLGDPRLRLEMAGVSVDPRQFLGLEISPRATAIADVVLWIGYLQWHRRVRGRGSPSQPVLEKFDNIKCTDALMRGGEAKGWTKADWPAADFIIGNPPFIGKLHMKSLLGSSYVDALRSAHADIPDSADYVMYFWHRAAQAVAAGRTRRFGLVTTSAITQEFNRRVVKSALEAEPSLRLVFAVPNHPWTDDGADVRVAMTVGEMGTGSGILATVEHEDLGPEGVPVVTFVEQVGTIAANLSVGVDVLQAQPLRSNLRLSSNGVMLGNRGFLLEPGEEMNAPPGIISAIVNGNDLVKLRKPRGLRVIDFHGLTAEQARAKAPQAYDRLLAEVKPQRDGNNRKSRRENWWLFAEVMPQLRAMLRGLRRYIVTPETNRHRVFCFLPTAVLPEHKLVAIASDDAYILGVLSSRVHTLWSDEQGGRRGVGNDPTYAKKRCFETFPFPDPSEAQRERIRVIAEELEHHRGAVREVHPDITISAMYGVLAKLRVGEQLSDVEQAIKSKAMLLTLRELHERLDREVLAAYGWPHELDGQALLGRLVQLNLERVAEEQAGRVRYLRPELGTDDTLPESQQRLVVDATVTSEARRARPPWPPTLAQQVTAITRTLAAQGRPCTPKEIARCFAHAREAQVRELLVALESLGLVVSRTNDSYVGQAS